MKRTNFWIPNFILILALIAMVGISLAEWKETKISRHIPLPKKIEIVPPSPNLPKEIAAFSGRWEGTWEGSRPLDSILIVENIEPEKAKVVYAWGGSYSTTRDYSRYTAKILPGAKPKLEFSSPYARFVFEMEEDLKTINGFRESSRGSRNTVKMKKIED